MLHATETSAATIDYLKTHVGDIIRPKVPYLAALCDTFRSAIDAASEYAAHLEELIKAGEPPQVLTDALRAGIGITTLLTVYEYGRPLQCSIHGTGEVDPENERRVWWQIRDVALWCAA